MDIRVWKVATFVAAAVAFVGVFMVILFGLRLSNLNQIKAMEQASALKAQETDIASKNQIESEKSTTIFQAEDVHGKFTFAYPKVWSTNVTRSDSDPELLFLGNPELIIMRSSEGPTSALRVVVSRDKYSDKIKAIESDIEGKNTKQKESDITLSNLKGKRFDGPIEESNGRVLSYAIFPLRDKTLYIGTDDYTKFSKQFEEILKSFQVPL